MLFPLALNGVGVFDAEAHGKGVIAYLDSCWTILLWTSSHKVTYRISSSLFYAQQFHFSMGLFQLQLKIAFQTCFRLKFCNVAMWSYKRLRAYFFFSHFILLVLGRTNVSTSSQESPSWICAYWGKHNFLVLGTLYSIWPVSIQQRLSQQTDSLSDERPRGVVCN